jgi:hypothetical protein
VKSELCGVALVLAVATPAHAAEGEPGVASAPSDPPARFIRSIDVTATTFVGDGLRFNNPYRLATVLGSTAQSLSRTATYADVGGAISFGDPARFSQGIALRVSISLEGTPQSVLTPAYMLLRRSGAWGVYGRAGVPLVLSPDTTWGFEGAAGGIWFLRAGIGIAGELVGDVFYGAGTREVSTPAYPVLSGQLGLWLSWEAIP